MFGVSDGLRPSFAFDDQHGGLVFDTQQFSASSPTLQPDFFKGLLDLGQELICCRKLDDTIIFANRAYCRFFGKQPFEITGTRWLPPLSTPDVSVLDRFAASYSGSAPARCTREAIIANKNVETIHVRYQGIFDTNRQLIGRCSIGSRHQIADARQEKKEYTLRQLAVSVAEAQERERRRIAVDIHDEIGQNLYLLRLRLDNLPHTPHPKNDQCLKELLAIIDATIEKTRSMTATIGSQILLDFGLSKAIKSIADDLADNFDLKVSLSVDDIPDDTPRVLIAVIYRGVRELAHNAAKHANARNVQIRLRCTPMFVYASVEDDGEQQKHELAEPDFGFGLRTLKEQLELLGGMFSISGKERPQGLKAEFALPLQSPQNN